MLTLSYRVVESRTRSRCSLLPNDIDLVCPSCQLLEGLMSLFPLFISSADCYADLWPTFFQLFTQYWPEYDGPIYLNTQEKQFEYPGLNIVCTQVGTLEHFGETFIAGLRKVDSPHLMLLMIDYFFMGKIDNSTITNYFKAFQNLNLSTLCLMQGDYRSQTPLSELDLDLLDVPTQHLFSFQIAFWKKAALQQMVLPHESPWLAEWYGTARANLMNLRVAVPRNNTPIPYLPEGALHKGKWVEPMVQFLNSSGYQIDYSKRGYFSEKPATLPQRIEGRISTFSPRLLSQVDLLKRRIFA